MTDEPKPITDADKQRLFESYVEQAADMSPREIARMWFDDLDDDAIREELRQMDEYDQEEDDEPRCSNPAGHEYPRDIEESDRCLCIHCGHDGDG